MQFYIDVTDSSGSKYGSGPIVSAHGWQSTVRLDRIGDFSFSMPAADPKAAAIENRRYVTCYAILPTGPAVVGAGIIDRVERRPDAEGNVDLVVSGSDLVKELTWRTVGAWLLCDGDLPKTHADSVLTLSYLLPAGWTVVANPSPPNDDLFYLWAGETMFAALAKVAELSRCHVYPSAAREMTFAHTFTDSGLRAIEAPPGADVSANENICYIDRVTTAVDSTDLVTRIYAIGGKIPDLPYTEYVSAYHYTKTATGYTDGYQAPIGYYLESDAGIAAYGRVEEWINYNDIKVVGSGVNYTTSAANQMFDLVLWELQRRGQPISYYTLSLAHSPTIIQPMTTIRCIFRRAIDGRDIANIDEQMYVMAATTTIDAEGMRTTGLEVATIDRWQTSDVDPVRKLMRDNLRQSY